MTPTFVTFEQADFLKKKDFDIPVDSLYSSYSENDGVILINQ